MARLFLLVLIVLTTILVKGSGPSPTFKVYPLADDYFEKVYLVSHTNGQYYLTIACREHNMLSISLTLKKDFQEHPRFNVYGDKYPTPKMGTGTYSMLRECQTEVVVNTSHIVEVRRTNGDILFAINNATFDNMHNSFKVVDHSVKWGLGERFQKNFKVIDGKWTLWNRDKPWKIDQGLPGISDQTYGFQPVYLARNKENKLHHLVYFKNTFGLLIEVEKNGSELQYHSVGGPIHFIILVGQEDPEEVLERYHQYIGAAHIPPFWSMGYHQCRWGYKTAGSLAKVMAKFNINDLPIDTIWSDLDYMDRKMIFTVNSATHGKGAINQVMKDHDVHFVPLLDAGVCIHDEEAMKLGKQLDVFLKSPRSPTTDYLAEVWPGQVHFVDFLHPNAFTFWKEMMRRLYKQVQFSGIWIDMNEPSNFRGNEPTMETFKIQKNEGINQMTINVDIPHHSQTREKLTHREVHTYYGHLSTIPIYQFLQEAGKRPFIISRSNSIGSGYFAGHWTGDNVANWQFLRASINGNFMYQIFGVQMVGSDICGFNKDTTEELCARWYQVGAFYPFSRNHNVDNARDQEPYSFGKMLTDTARESLKTRYALLKHMYTVMVLKKGKGSFFRPLNFEFPLDENVYEDETIETQFLIGRGLMVAPIVYTRVNERKVYFPGSDQTWYSFKIDTQTGKPLVDILKTYNGTTQSSIVNTMPSAAPTFIRSGYSILLNTPTLRSKQLTNRFHLLAALKNGGSATSMLTISDYEHEPSLLVCIEEGCSMEVVLRRVSGNDFVLQWKYNGNRGVQGELFIDSIVAVEGGSRWSYSSVIAVGGLDQAASLTMAQF